MESLFWVSTAIVLYVYAGYPLLLAAWVRLAGRPPRHRPADAPRRWPSVSIIIGARNQAQRLPARVANLLMISYTRALNAGGSTALVLQPGFYGLAAVGGCSSRSSRSRADASSEKTRAAYTVRGSE